MNPWMHVAGWTLIHFVWQGAVLAMVAAGVLRLCWHRSATTRYAIGCVSLAAMLVAPMITAAALWTPASDRTPVGNLRQAVSAPEIVSTGSGSGANDGPFSILTVRARVEAWLPSIVFVWLAGVTVLLFRLMGGLWQVRRLQVTSLAAAVSRWQVASEGLASRLGLRVAVRVVDSALVDTPTAVGWLRPVILLPIAAFANLTPAQVDMILAHELAHIQRYDYVVNVLQTFAETLFFYHPGVWWVSGRIRTEREHCCDDVAVDVCGDAVGYATALAALEAWRSREPTLAVAVTSGSLTDRVRRVLRVPMGHEPRSLGWAMTLGLTLVLVVGMGSIYLRSFASSTGAPAITAGTAQVAPLRESLGPFDWQVHSTDHFDIYYYTALAEDLEHITGSAERAYRWVSAELRHNLAFKMPLILFKTRRDFARQAVAPEANLERVTAFAEPEGNRIVVLLDAEQDETARRITHNVTHVFSLTPFQALVRAAGCRCGSTKGWRPT